MSDRPPSGRGRRLPPLLRYAAVGTAATLVHYAVLVLAVEVGGWPAWLAAGTGAVVGAQVAYLGNRRFTFGHAGPAAASWPRFQVTAVVGAACAVALVAAAGRVGVHYLIGQALATVAAMGLTYAINRRWTFAARRRRG